jgi:multimeric flavodoxin WrbA
MARKIIAITGSYRRSGTIEHAVDAILDKARKLGYDLAR